MFIEKLSKQECTEIMQNLLSLHYTPAFAEYIINESMLVKGEHSLVLQFPSLLRKGNWENRCRISDFSAMVFGQDNIPLRDKKVDTTYRKKMYEKFGEEYYLQLKERLESNIEIERLQKISAMNHELDKITGGKHSAQEIVNCK